MSQINASEFAARVNAGETLNLLDVRELIEYHTYNIGGKNIPLSQVVTNINQLHYNKTDEIIVICKAGIRSKTACILMMQNGYEQVKNLTGGLLALQRLKQ
jgi:rhodanese-related sulfurtransferase